jgi:hypothetical protein
MSFDVLGDLNWLVVLVAAVAYFVLGALWYAPPVFGKVWAAAGGFDLPERGSARARRSTSRRSWGASCPRSRSG